MTGTFTDNTAQRRYEYHVDSAFAFADYRDEGTTRYINYVESPDALRGTGAAGKLMQHVMDKARQDNVKVIPVCGYAASWIRKHTEFHDLLA